MHTSLAEAAAASAVQQKELRTPVGGILTPGQPHTPTKRRQSNQVPRRL